MISIKSKNFREKIGRIFDIIVGEQEVVSGVYLSMDSAIACKIEKYSDRVVVDFSGDTKPRIRISLAVFSLPLTNIERVTIYKNRAVIKLNMFPDIEIVED